MTGRDLISASLRVLGALASGDSLGAQEAKDGLDSLNRLFGTWSAENLMIYSKGSEVFALISGTQTYTMGPGGMFDTVRPAHIESAFLRMSSSNPASDVPLRILSQDEWAAITIKTLQSTIPSALYSEGSNPLETLNLWPVPSQANSLVIYSTKPLTSIATLDTVITLPPGYERALVFNLAVDLSPEYGRAISDVIAGNAIESKASLKRANYRPDYLRVDAALRPNANTFNWLTGETT